MYLRHLFAITLAVASLSAAAQGTIEDYNRAYAAPKVFASSNVYYSNVRPVWLDGTSFWYVRETPDGRRFVKVDARSQKRTPLFDHRKLAGAISAATGRHTSPDSLYPEHLRVTSDSLFFNLNGVRWAYSGRKGVLNNRGPVPTPPQSPHWMVVDKIYNFVIN